MTPAEIVAAHWAQTADGGLMTARFTHAEIARAAKVATDAAWNCASNARRQATARPRSRMPSV